VLQKQVSSCHSPSQVKGVFRRRPFCDFLMRIIVEAETKRQAQKTLNWTEGTRAEARDYINANLVIGSIGRIDDGFADDYEYQRKIGPLAASRDAV
jgi:hypothetical protein